MRILPNGVAVCGTTHIAIWCETEGLVHDKWFADYLTKVIRDHNVKTIVQGGAFIGTMTKPMLDAGCMVWAFEPNPDAVKCLLHNCDRPNLHVITAALGDDVIKCALKIDTKNSGKTHVQFGFTTNLVTVDLFNLRPDLIFLDVEGYEPFVLDGARETICRCRPVIIAEVNQMALKRYAWTPEMFFEKLDGMNYRCEIVQSNCSWSDEQFDIIARPK